MAEHATGAIVRDVTVSVDHLNQFAGHFLLVLQAAGVSQPIADDLLSEGLSVFPPHIIRAMRIRAEQVAGR